MTLLEIAIIIAEKEDRAFDLPYLEMLKDRIKIWRSTILRQTLKDNPFDLSYYLHSYILDMEVKPSFIYGYDVGVNVLVSVNKIYTPLRVNDTVEFVGSIDFTTSFGKANLLSVITSINRKYTKNEPFYNIIDNKIIIYNTLELPAVGILGTLDFPEQVKLDKDPTLNIDTMDFLCTNDIIQKIIQAIWAEDLRIKDDKREEQIPLNPIE